MATKIKRGAWSAPIKLVYDTLEDLEFDFARENLRRLGYPNARTLWNDNPVVGRSGANSHLQIVS